MFRDEGAEPSIQFKQRMRERVERTPTSIVIAVLPFVITARVAMFARHAYIKAHSKSLTRRINASSDLRTIAVSQELRLEIESQVAAGHIDQAA